MYLNFYDFKKEPFQITPDPSFLYLSHGHKEALASIIYGVEKRKGFVLITGAVGVGKTTILRAYLEKADPGNLRIVYIFNSCISYINLLRHILAQLNLVPQSAEASDMVSQLHQKLLDDYKEGRNVLLLIDEAQNMPVDTLENLRMLSNFETSSEKLIQIIFSAQPEFEKTMNLDELRQLKQRVAVKATISPLTIVEGIAYIHHRLRTAGRDDRVIFTERALREIVKKAHGIPRVINIVCDNCLITAYGYGKKKVGATIVREISRDFGMQNNSYERYSLAFIVVLFFALAAFAIKTLPLRNLQENILPLQGMRVPPLGPTLPLAKAATSEPRAEKAYAKRVIQKGDTLAKLIKEVYGRVDAEMIGRVKKANPGIIDENVIVEGGVIIFP